MTPTPRVIRYFSSPRQSLPYESLHKSSSARGLQPPPLERTDTANAEHCYVSEEHAAPIGAVVRRCLESPPPPALYALRFLQSLARMVILVEVVVLKGSDMAEEDEDVSVPDGKGGGLDHPEFWKYPHVRKESRDAFAAPVSNKHRMCRTVSCMRE
jgi:hypothetical protein